MWCAGLRYGALCNPVASLHPALTLTPNFPSLSPSLLLSPSPSLPPFCHRRRRPPSQHPGGASGLGESTARKLHSLGAYVGVLDLNLSAAQSVADSLNQRGFDEEAVGERGAVGSVGAVGGKREGAGGEGGKGGKGGKRAHGIKCDVTSEEDVIKAIEELDRIWKGVNVGGVVNCGGVAMAGKVSFEV